MDGLLTTRSKTRNVISKLLTKLENFKNSSNSAREDVFVTLKQLGQLQIYLQVLDEKIPYQLEIEKIEEEIVTASEYSFDVEVKVRRYRNSFQFSENLSVEDTSSCQDIQSLLEEEELPHEENNHSSATTSTSTSRPQTAKGRTSKKIPRSRCSRKKQRRTKIIQHKFPKDKMTTVRKYKRIHIRNSCKFKQKRKCVPVEFQGAYTNFGRTMRDHYLFVLLSRSVCLQWWKTDT